MNWNLDPKISLRNDRVKPEDADRQQRTAAEILRRFATQPGLILADEVGMGKTYVALAVAVSVIEATNRKHPVVVMVPSSVAEKWPVEWEVFSRRCLPPGHRELRAAGPVRSGSEFLKLLDDPASRRKHLIFLTHGALTRNLNDPFIRLALLRRAMLWHPELATRRRAIARSAYSLLRDHRFTEPTTIELLNTPESQWRDAWARVRPHDPLPDDPVPAALERALSKVDLAPLRDAIASVPVQHNATFKARITRARTELSGALNSVWTECLWSLSLRLPLLILDEAHHVKNRNQLSRLFDNEEAEEDLEALQGPLGNKFEKMMFLTATPFQLGHNELLSVLKRFHGIRWPSRATRDAFNLEMEQLKGALDQAQSSTLRFQTAWSKVDPLDVDLVGDLTESVPAETEPDALRSALSCFADAERDVRAAEVLLQPWVIRHVRHDKAQRRYYRLGRSILDHSGGDVGLSVSGSSTLPFLLAARVEALAALQGSDARRSVGAYFTYGLASSFEAYRDTRANRAPSLDDQDGKIIPATEVPKQVRWYLDRIDQALPAASADGWLAHPKMAATTERVRQLWCQGEKALVFCFYVQTGRALRSHISRALHHEIVTRAARQLSLDPADEAGVLAAVDRVSEQLLRSDTRGFRLFQGELHDLLAGLDADTQTQVAEVVTRFMRTPSFLVRFVELSSRLSIDALIEALRRRDDSGTALTDRVRAFAQALQETVEGEREELMTALNGIQTGGISVKEDHFDPSERTRQREVLLPNVRLANGGVKRETRHRLMLAFNTPFFPEVLVASSVMAEGVDLHQDCRHVIHHDLDWNPSVIEQRTGRVDRIRSKGERLGLPVVVYEPYIGGTHDEKMFRVVKDRERWFAVVMGESSGSGAVETEAAENRVPLPAVLAHRLIIDLAVVPAN